MINASTGFPALIIVAACAAGVLVPGCAAPDSGPDEAHHTKDGFRNLTDHEDRGFADLLKWNWERIGKDIPGPEAYSFPLAENDPAFLRSNRGARTLTWIGHATVLLQTDSLNILTDPHFSRRASPVQWAGPERVVEPGLALDELPPIDIVLISHDHYDALDPGSVKKLSARKEGSRTTFFVGLGLADWFKSRGISNVVELDWWEQRRVGNVSVTAVPVQHWSKRGLFGRNKTLWAGWVIKSDDFSFLFTGDSGYTALFKEIGQRLGPFDLAAIPIGTYEPRWFMKPHHMSPEEAVQVHLDLNCRKSVAIHWGTFILTDEPLDEPPRRLVRSLEQKGLGKENFLVLRHGETITLD